MSVPTATLMATTLSRMLRDGDVVATGTNAAVAAAACGVARQTHAPNLVPVNGALGTVEPSTILRASSADVSLGEGRFNMAFADVLRAETRGIFDVVFLGALQVDRHGACNMALIGDPTRPTLRGPGTLGLSLMATYPRTLIYLMRHDPRVFVERVDFVSGEGFQPEGRGIQSVVTPMCVLEPDAARRQLELVSVHPGWSIQDVRDQTGYELAVRPGAGETAPPSAAELKALELVDPEGVLDQVRLHPVAN